METGTAFNRTLGAQETLSGILRLALDVNRDGKVSVGEVIDRVADRGFGFLIILIALPTLIPILPPGSTGPIGTLLALIGIQMLIGLRHPWLPQRVRNYQLSPKIIQMLQDKGGAFMKRVEKISKPRLTFLENPITHRLLAVLIILLGIILASPMPFMNLLPGIAFLLIGVGMINRDGILMLAGAALGVAITVFTALSLHLLIAAFQKILGWF